MHNSSMEYVCLPYTNRLQQVEDYVRGFLLT